VAANKQEVGNRSQKREEDGTAIGNEERIELLAFNPYPLAFSFEPSASGSQNPQCP